jgi:hypothetical protein|tara:strand:- start:24 stop:404 length:381 start_codon:yes stop_codon:yes gene_type:complete
MTERQLFEFVKEMIPDLKMSEYKFSKYDCYSEKWRMDIELKCRRAHYDDLLIEWIKYDALMQRAMRFNTRPVYINSTPIGIWVFYLDDMYLNWEERQMPKTTDFGNNARVNKKVGYLNINEGKRLE